MSTDLNISRPTSRVSRPPGGHQTFSFGDSEPSKPIASPAKPYSNPITGNRTNFPPAPPTQAQAAAEAAPVPPPAPVKKVVEGKVGVVIAGAIEPDALAAAIVKALVIEGIHGTVVAKVPDTATLPYAAQNLSSKVDVVIAGTFVGPDPNGAVSAALSSTLLQLGTTGKVPIIPAMAAGESLLEAKALLSNSTTGWAQSAATILNMKKGGANAVKFETFEEPVIKEKPVFTTTETSVDTLMECLRESLKKHGARGIVGLARKFKIADDNHNGTLDIQEFTKVINEHKLGWTAAQIKLVFDRFDDDKSGSITYDEFLFAVRGALNERRKGLVLLAYQRLDADKSGSVDIHDISQKYNAKKHPEVIAGKRTEESVLREFLDTFDTEEKDGVVTLREFEKYYGNVSSSIDDDDYFELMIRNAWHISGGEGWCANSSCTRVLVQHTDGRQTVEEITDDLGMDPKDKDAVLANFAAQGITDVEFYELNSGLKVYANGPGSASTTAAAAPAAAPAAAAAAGTVPANNGRPATAASNFNPRRQPGGASSLILG